MFEWLRKSIEWRKRKPKWEAQYAEMQEGILAEEERRAGLTLEERAGEDRRWRLAWGQLSCFKSRPPIDILMDELAEAGITTQDIVDSIRSAVQRSKGGG